MRHALFATLTLIAALTASFGAVAGHHLESEKTSISKLSWMTGSWSGDIGGPVLEENWTEAKAGSIAALVRITSPEGTAMVEIVNIQEMDGTLVLHIQQWDPGFVARAEAQKMVLDSMGEQRVSFGAASSTGAQARPNSVGADGAVANLHPRICTKSSAQCSAGLAQYCACPRRP